MPEPLPPLLPTTVVGSWPVPRWLAIVRDLHASGRLRPAEAEEAYDDAVMSCLKDQELAGIDLITDGELRRESMIDFFARHIRGFRLGGPPRPVGLLDPDLRAPAPVVDGRLMRGDLPLVPHWRFAEARATKPVKVCVTGPHTLTKRSSHRSEQSEREVAWKLAVILNAELRDLARAGCRHIQIDEPAWAGYPEEVRAWGIGVFHRLVQNVDVPVALHVCYGNVERQPLYAGLYRQIISAMAAAPVTQLMVETAVDDLEQIEDITRQLPATMTLGIGVIDVKTGAVESADLVAARVRQALRRVPPERLAVHPDCGLRYLRRASPWPSSGPW